MRARRVAALWLPGLPLQAVGRDDPAMRARPVAVTDGRVVLARNRRAVEAGVAVGMGVAEAATHAPNLALAPDDPERSQAFWDVVLDQLDALGPLVEDAGLGLALVDVTGVGRGEQPLVRRTLRSLGTFLGVTARAAVADGPFVAAVAARRATQELTIISRYHGAAFLAPLPAYVLPLPGRAIDDLMLLGIGTVGRFAGLRLSEVQARYGMVGMAAFSLAIGRDDRPLVPRVRERRATLSYPFEPPVDDVSPVLFVAKALLGNHAAILRREGMVAGGLSLTLTVEGRTPVVIEQRWGAPCVPGDAEFDALRLVLADALPGTGEDGALPPRVASAEVTLLDCAPARGMQLPLFGADIARQREAVAHLLTRLHALLGPMGVVEDVVLGSHAVEERWTSRPYDAARVGTLPIPDPPAESPSVPSLPGFTIFRPPDPVAVAWMGERAATLHLCGGDGRDGWHADVIASLGPYRTEGRWWDAGRVARTYWLLVTDDQTMHLVVEDRATGAWTRVGVVD